VELPKEDNYKGDAIYSLNGKLKVKKRALLTLRVRPVGERQKEDRAGSGVAGGEMKPPKHEVARYIAALPFTRNSQLHKKPVFLTLMIANYVLIYQVYPKSEKDTTPLNSKAVRVSVNLLQSERDVPLQ
jgi:hypothetical protein